MKKTGAFREYTLFRKPSIISFDTSMKLPKKKGLSVSFGLRDHATDEAVWVELSKRDALVLATELMYQLKHRGTNA